MCNPADLGQDSSAGVRMRRFPSHERLEQLKSAAVGFVMKTKGGAVRMRDKGIQADVQPPLKSRMVKVSFWLVITSLMLNQLGLFIPIVMMARNSILTKTPRNIRAKYPECPADFLSSEMTIVVSVKDACSQAPGFIRSLERFAPPGVHLIYTYPNFESCASIDLKDVLARWKKVTLLPLPLRSSPMQGWVDAVPHIKTKYSMLLHNDGYASATLACTAAAICQRRERSSPLDWCSARQLPAGQSAQSACCPCTA